MSSSLTDRDLEAYLDERLDAATMTRVEVSLRADPALLERLAQVNARRNRGGHSIGDIWQRSRLTCPSREELANCLLGVLSTDVADYIRFHVERIGCRWCQANWEDLQVQSREAPQAIQNRRRRFYESSVSSLKWKRD
ncbi:MAG: hypothetical protein ACKOBW_09665 [Planctomycetota bacterium]